MSRVFAAVVLASGLVLSLLGCDYQTTSESRGGVTEIAETLSPDRLRLIPVRTLGGEDETDPSAILGRPDHLETDKDGRVYVSDLFSNSIKVFSRDGEFVREIGGHGRAPGEFKHITSFTVTDSAILVADEMSNRITEFALDGTVLATYETDDNEILWPRALVGVKDGFVALYKMPQLRPSGEYVRASEHLLHQFRLGQTTAKGRSGETEVILPDTTVFTDLIFQRHPGLLLRRDERILYVPYINLGRVYSFPTPLKRQALPIVYAYELPNSGFTKGYVSYGSFTSDTDTESDRFPDRTRFINFAGQKHVGIVLSENIGLASSGSQIEVFSLQREPYTNVAPAPELFLRRIDLSSRQSSVHRVLYLHTSSEMSMRSPLPPMEIYRSHTGEYYVLHPLTAELFACELNPDVD